MSLIATKTLIWIACNRNPVTVQVYADKAGVRLPITQLHEAEKLLNFINKPPKVKRKVVTPAWCIERYIAAHKQWFIINHPNGFRDGHYLIPKIPDLTKSNGITSFVQNYITWSGGYANRINVSGRKVGGKWIKSSTKAGTEDIDAMWQGRKIAIEIKNAATNDKLRPEQINQRSRIQAAGGIYIIVTSAESFFTEWDIITNSLP